MQRGAPGAVAKLNDVASIVGQGTDAAASDRRLEACLPPLVRSRIGSGDLVANFMALIASLRRVPAAEAANALAIVEAACRPADASLVLAELTRCFAVTKARDDGDANLQATLSVLVEELEDFPPDVIRDALRSWARQERFRPSLAEVREYCWARFGRRHTLRISLKDALRQGELPPEPTPPTPEERAEVAAMIAAARSAMVDTSALTERTNKGPAEGSPEAERMSAAAMELVRRGMGF
jgi:hypothetical protein